MFLRETDMEEPSFYMKSLSPPIKNLNSACNTYSYLQYVFFSMSKKSYYLIFALLLQDINPIDMKKILSFMLTGMLGATTILAQPRYDLKKMVREDLGRGMVALRQNKSKVAVSWRYLSSDPINTSFNIYRNDKKIAHIPATASTLYTDAYSGKGQARYEVRPVINGKETGHKNGSYTLPANAPIGYIDIPLKKPKDGVTPAGDTYSYTPNDASIGDVDGDGEYEIILKWDPTNSHDNSHDGYSGNVYVDCYRLDGTHMWRIDLGKNIRAGAHYTQFMVYDLDGDGKAEVVMRTADGTTDGKGKVIGDAKADWREPGEWYTPRKKKGGTETPEKKLRYQGRIFKGKEYLTVFSGLTGAALYTTDYIPQRGDMSSWGDNRANRSDRFLACVAYLDGIHPSVVMCRGYYTRIVLAAFDWNGKELKKHWVFDTNTPGNEAYAKQGNHNLRVGDVDGDGCDEIVYGSMTVDNNGKGLYSTGYGHGDALQMTQFSADDPHLQVFACHENKRDGTTFRDASTGKTIWQIKSTSDVGRCMAADIDPTNYGLEMWSARTNGIRNIKGELVGPKLKKFPINMGIWWDGDLLRELYGGTVINKYDWKNQTFAPLVTFDGVLSNNSSKANPCLAADIIGDWREELLFRTEDNEHLRLYVSTLPTDYRFHTFLEDPIYRISVATENVGYNQSTQPGFYFGPDLKKCTFRGYLFK